MRITLPQPLVTNPASAAPGALIGFRRNGQPIRLIAGGDGTNDSGDGGQGADPDGEPNAGGQTGGPGGEAPGTGKPPTKPLAEMNDAEQAAYWKRQARKHEQRVKASDVQPGELEKLRADRAELERIRDQGRSETEKAARRAEQAERELAQVRPELARLRMALVHGLGEEMATRVQGAARRLVGTTDEELAADAADYFTAAPLNSPAAGSRPGAGSTFDQGVRRRPPATRTVSAGRDLWRQRHPTKT